MATSKRTSPTREVGRVADRLHSAAIHLLRRLRVEDEALGISAPRLSLLSVLVFAGPKRIGELARVEQVEPPTISRLVDGLVRDGLAVREPDRMTRGRCASARRRPVPGRCGGVVRDGSRPCRPDSGPSPPPRLATLGEGVEVLERILRDR